MSHEFRGPARGRSWGLTHWERPRAGNWGGHGEACLLKEGGQHCEVLTSGDRIHLARRGGVGFRVGKRPQWDGVGLLESQVTESGALHKGSGSVGGESLSYLGSSPERENP